jgi:hypothetical protein
VDKRQIIYSINELRMPGTAGKTLYPAGSDRGQKAGLAKKTGFCTSVAVDMQTVFHSCLPGCGRLPQKLPGRHAQGYASQVRANNPGGSCRCACVPCFSVDQSGVRMATAAFTLFAVLVDVQPVCACPRQIGSLF